MRPRPQEATTAPATNTAAGHPISKDRPDDGFIPGFIGSPARTLPDRVIRGGRPDVGPGGIAAEVVPVEATGAEAPVVTRVGGQVVARLLRHRVDRAPGDTIGLDPVFDRVHLFDADTSTRL